MKEFHFYANELFQCLQKCIIPELMLHGNLPATVLSQTTLEFRLKGNSKFHPATAVQKAKPAPFTWVTGRVCNSRAV